MSESHSSTNVSWAWSKVLALTMHGALECLCRYYWSTMSAPAITPPTRSRWPDYRLMPNDEIIINPLYRISKFSWKPAQTSRQCGAYTHDARLVPRSVNQFWLPSLPYNPPLACPSQLGYQSMRAFWEKEDSCRHLIILLRWLTSYLSRSTTTRTANPWLILAILKQKANQHSR